MQHSFIFLIVILCTTTPYAQEMQSGTLVATIEGGQYFIEISTAKSYNRHLYVSGEVYLSQPDRYAPSQRIAGDSPDDLRIVLQHVDGLRAEGWVLRTVTNETTFADGAPANNLIAATARRYVYFFDVPPGAMPAASEPNEMSVVHEVKRAPVHASDAVRRVQILRDRAGTGYLRIAKFGQGTWFEIVEIVDVPLLKLNDGFTITDVEYVGNALSISTASKESTCSYTFKEIGKKLVLREVRYSLNQGGADAGCRVNEFFVRYGPYERTFISGSVPPGACPLGNRDRNTFSLRVDPEVIWIDDLRPGEMTIMVEKPRLALRF
ncbi:hypothetical protein [Neolewinella antarctica]|uniref:Uncharacterized protein n=1 Tax=Neolewinella antarctica TaxID=442734 RepID=A0ABX0X7L9_9BACT|nr:hypothetical protein [Neolewinella antarctica]NJC24996.1 hypothetical protein [Neolewinella antarctica]